MLDMPALASRTARGGAVRVLDPGTWRLSIPAGPAGCYRWAQLDDYMHRARAAFPWQPPLRLSLRARASGVTLPGTWGFGLWNDPFSASLSLGGTARRLPALPNALWFFHASPPNCLTLRDMDAQGFLAATFASTNIPPLVWAPGSLALPLLAWPPFARWLRRLARRFIQEDATRLAVNPVAWHSYGLEWRVDGARMFVDGTLCFETEVVPRVPLGLVLWIDNQYAAFPPEGRLRFGTLPNPEPVWLDLAEVTVVALRS